MRSAGGLSSFGRCHCQDTALSIWKLFVDDGMVDMIVDCTNTKAHSLNANFATNREELTTFIGICILIGVYKGRDEPIRATWSELEGRKCVTQFMSRSGFE
jgi:hypothetical protein